MTGKRIKGFYDRNAQLYRQLLSTPPIKELERDEVKNVSALMDVEGKSVLDVGCGYGKYFSTWGDHGARSMVGLDFSLDMLELAKRENVGTECVLGDGFHLPFKDKSFDFATCVGLSIYYKHFDSLVEEMARVTREACLIGFSPRSMMSLAYKSSKTLKTPSRRLAEAERILGQHFQKLSFQSCGLGLTLLCKGEAR